MVVSMLVGHRSHAMKPRQSRQVRKEATVTGRFVCSEVPVSGFMVLLKPSLPGFSHQNFPIRIPALFWDFFSAGELRLLFATRRSWGMLVSRGE